VPSDGTLVLSARQPCQATATAGIDGTYTIAVAATDVGLDRVNLEIGDSALPFASPAVGSTGTASWSTAVIDAGQQLQAELAKLGGTVPPGGLQVSVNTTAEILGQPSMTRYAFGAQLAEVHIDTDSREVRVPRMLGVFAAGKIMNPKLACSQYIGGMTWGLSMAPLEEASSTSSTATTSTTTWPSTASPSAPTSAASTFTSSRRPTTTSAPRRPRESARSASLAPPPTPSTMPPASASATCPSAWTG
jgi:CO/xanthine dehydrogenase Mo-binding subunit